LQFVIDELQKSRNYHNRQLNDNKLEIEAKKESIASLEERNARHEEAIRQIEEHLDNLKAKELNQ